MEADRFARLKEVLLQASDLPETERAAFLDTECAQDPEMRQEIETLLAQEADRRSFLESGELLPTLQISHPPGRTAGAPMDHPREIGSYKIVRKLGEGGMGVVYEAKQQSPRREVALKVVRGGQLVTELSVKLFQREAETLGRLKHPAIGAVYESGCTAEGQHFFAMELVRGEPLNRHVEGRGRVLTRDEIRYRLQLFREICDAVNYAHQRGVIHRDLKPSNILITEDGQPKVLDFGLARITDADTAALSIATEVGAIKGTLPYMSPEQTRGNPDEIDVRTDVYSLGIILYELMSGRLPYDTAKSAIVEAIRVITDMDPAPFHSIATVVKLAGGDVETIVRKALEKDPDQRYANAAALSDDIERYLTDQPIQAVPPSTMYQLRKFVRRNRWGVSVVAGAVLLLTAFAVMSTVQARRVAHARDEARGEAARAEAMNAFLRDMLKSADPWKGGDRDATVAETLDGAAQHVGETFHDQPVVEAEMREQLGDVYASLGQRESAGEQFRKAMEICTRELGLDDDRVGSLWKRIANLAAQNRDAEGSIEAYKQAARIVTLNHPDPTEETCTVLHGMATAYYEASRYAEAESVLALGEGMVGSVPGDTGLLRSQYAALRGRLAFNFGNDFSAGDSLMTLALDLRRAADPDDPRIGYYLNDLALQQLSRGNLDVARSLFQETIDFNARVFGTEHPNYATAMENSGQVDFREKKYDAVLATLEKVREIRARNLGESHIDVLRTRLNIAAVSAAAGSPEQAIDTYDEILHLLREARGESHVDVAAVLANRGRALFSAGRSAEGEASFRQAADMYLRLELPAKAASTRRDLALQLKKQGRLAAAGELLVQAFPVLRETYGDGAGAVQGTASLLVEIYEGLGHPEKADEYRPFMAAPAGL